MAEIRVLLLEEEKKSSHSLWDELKGKGISVTWVQNLGDCLAVVESHRDSIVIVDLDVYTKGVETLEEIAKVSPQIILIATASQERLAAAEEALEHGATDYIIKQPDSSHVRELPQAIARNLERRRLAEQRQRSQQETQWLMAALWESQDGFFVAEPEGKIIFANPALCARLGYNGGGLVGQSLSAVLTALEPDPSSWVDVSEPVRHRKCQGKIVIKARDGSELPMATRMAEILGDEGEVGALIVSCLQQDRQEAQTRRDSAAAPGDGAVTDQSIINVIMEDVRSPLAALMGYLEIVSMISPERVESGQYLAIKRVEILARRVLDVTTSHAQALEIDAGKFELNVSPIRIHRIVEIAIEDKTPEAQAKNIEIVLEADRDIPTRNFDALQMERAFEILISNAIALAPQGGRVLVTTKLNGNEILVRITDNGAGISKEEMPFLFDRTKKFRSRGMQINPVGLYVARHIVTAHDGRIEVHSEPQKGSTFSVHLPV